jgi:DNA polymerase-3 subunit delta'
VTVASRCVRIDLPPLQVAEVEGALLAEGASAQAAAVAAAAAMGDVDRARLLLTDEGVGTRRDAWAGVPRRLDGSGAAVAALAAELLDQVERGAAPLQAATRPRSPPWRSASPRTASGLGPQAARGGAQAPAPTPPHR